MHVIGLINFFPNVVFVFVLSRNLSFEFNFVNSGGKSMKQAGKKFKAMSLRIFCFKKDITTQQNDSSVEFSPTSTLKKNLKFYQMIFSSCRLTFSVIVTNSYPYNSHFGPISNFNTSLLTYESFSGFR